MPKRSRMEIYFDVLSVIASGEEKPTRIMYGANLSWRGIQTMLSNLITQGFIEEAGCEKGKRYRITTKGENALHYYLRAVKDITTLEVLPDVK